MPAEQNYKIQLTRAEINLIAEGLEIVKALAANEVALVHQPHSTTKEQWALLNAEEKTEALTKHNAVQQLQKRIG